MLLFLLACQNTKSISEAQLIDASTSGPYTVATAEHKTINDAGEEMSVQFWYPSTAPTPVEGELLRYDGVALGGAIDGPADCSSSRPVLLFSHGNSGVRYQSYFLAEFLSSHGFVVAAPDHVGNTFLDWDESRMSEMVFRRPDDIQRSYELLLTDAELQDCIDEAAGYAIAGHSFGGYTTVALSGAVIDPSQTLEHCEDNGGWLCGEVETHVRENGLDVVDLSDQRIWAGIPMAPAGYETLLGGLDLVQIPMLVMGGGRDDSTTMEGNVRPIYDGLRSSTRWLLELPNAGHYTFSNACELLSAYPDCAGDYIPTSEAHSLINQATLQFLGTRLGWQFLEELPFADPRIVWEESAE